MEVFQANWRAGDLSTWRCPGRRFRPGHRRSSATSLSHRSRRTGSRP